ncbi:MAG TPA: extracellular solute-binding protein [Stellaceae bacterium]|nr:extracellular solute-binding protein [Stellaceae bacterium]
MIATPHSAARVIALGVLAALLATAARADVKPSPVTPELIAAAKKEGKVVFYTAMDVEVAAKLGAAFEAKYPGISAQVERSGAERIFQRVEQEYTSSIHAVDAIDSSDVAHLLYWKREGLLAQYQPEDVARWPKGAHDPDGYYAVNRATLSVVGYNTKLVNPEEAPKSYADLLDPKWKGKIVKAHPGYSGNIMTATFELSHALGWDYFKKLGQQQIMQVQSSTEPPKKLALGERPLMFDGNEYNALLVKRRGAPVQIVYPSEGTPLVSGSAGVMKDAPHPNAGRLFISFLFSREGQQLLVDMGQLRSFHPDVKEPADRVPLSSIKVLTADPAEQEKAIAEIKRRYAEYFGT